MKIKRGDTVKILYGKDAGKTGAVLAVNPKRDMIIVDGINMYKRSIKGDGNKKKSEIINIVKPLPVSKVMIVCPSCGKPVRIGIKRVGSKYERVCKNCGKTLEVIKPTEKKVIKKSDKK